MLALLELFCAAQQQKATACSGFPAQKKAPVLTGASLLIINYSFIIHYSQLRNQGLSASDGRGLFL